MPDPGAGTCGRAPAGDRRGRRPPLAGSPGRVGAAIAVLCAALAACSPSGRTAAGQAASPGALAREQVPSPLVTGPVGGHPLTSSTVPLAPAGYIQQEFFLRGTATSYQPAGSWGSDGRWAVRPAGQARYETRILVRRPADPARFNGTVVVEWLDAPGGRDSDPEFLWENAELLRSGYAWVGVTTDGTVGQPASIPVLTLQDPGRYGTLTAPGTEYGYSIYSQAAEALLHPAAVNPLGPLRPRVLIADGDSGAAHSLVTYANAIQPADRLFGGFLIHGRGSNSAALAAGRPVPTDVRIRADIGVPVLTVESESEILDPGVKALDYYPATQPDSADFRLWEVPGTSHVDAALLGLASGQAANAAPGPLDCALPVNDGQESYVMDTALAQLNRWVRDGIPATRAPRIEVRDGRIVRDQYGNALGGIRTPALQVPAATLSGYGNRSASGATVPGGVTANPCELAGTSIPFSPRRLRALYPTHADYAADVARAAAADVASGFLLPADARQIDQAAQAAPVPPA
jgi:Alpha/beta hydrolase domain